MAPKKYKKIFPKGKCGKQFGNLCSEVFKTNYTVEDIRIILFSKKKYRSYSLAFHAFPKDENNKYDPIFMRNFEKNLYDEVFRGILNNENDHDYIIENIHRYVSSSIGYALIDYGKDENKVRQLTVDKEIIEDLRTELNDPELRYEKLFDMVVNKDDSKGHELLAQIKEIPGYRKVWFKVKSVNRDGEKLKKLFMFETEQDRKDKIEDRYRKTYAIDDISDNGGYSYSSDELEKMEAIIKKGYKSFTTLEKCIFKYHIRKSWSAKDVKKKCWGRNVSQDKFDDVLLEIIKKLKNEKNRQGNEKR